MRRWLVLAAIAACGHDPRGKAAIDKHGCAACHDIPGIHAIGGRGGLVGPPLAGFARRSYIAGHLPNTPENLVIWIRNPHAVDPGTAMPVLGLTEQEARDAAAYLLDLD
jgi:cytochrome c1